MNFIDSLVLVIYVLTVTGFGLLFYRRASDTEGFTVANRRLPGWVVGLSIFGTYLSSISFLALPGKAYSTNWSILAFALSLPIAAYVATRWFIPLYRSTNDISAYAYLERRFGLWARLYASFFYLLTQLARMGTIIFLVALALQSLTDWNIVYIILVTGIIITLYTVVGGIEAVIWTDALQSIVLTAGAIICVIVLLVTMPGGVDQAISIASDNNKFSLGSFELIFTEPTFWVVLIYGLVINLQNFGIDQSYVQRYQAAVSTKEARKSVWIGALIYIPVGVIFLFIGSILFSYYQAQPELLPEALKAAESADKIFPHFIATQLPTGVRGLLIAALFAAAMSSADTSINSSATILMTDGYQRLINPQASEKNKILFLRVATLGLGVLGTCTALMMISIKSALDVWWNLAGIFSGGMIGLFLLGVLSRRARSMEAGFAMVIGLLVIIWAALSTKLGWPMANPLHPLMTTVVGTLTLFLVGILLSRHKNRMGYKKPARTIYDLQEDITADDTTIVNDE